ncbi:MAG: C4-type zinc ribbon domain-containing protein [Myxococcaceae bacterium]
MLALAALQKVDLDIAALKKNAEAYPREMSELEKQLATAKAAVDTERTKLDQLEVQKRGLEQTISDEKDKVRKWEARLSEQRSTREYSALAREIDIAKKGQMTMSEDVQELGKQIIIQRDVVKTKEGEFTGKTKDLVDRIDALKAKLAEVESQVKSIDEKRAEAAKAVDGSLLRQYDSVRKKRMPAMVSVAAPGTCGGCRMNIPAQRFNQLVASRGIDTCPSCTRMIYAAEVLEDPKPAAAK